MSRLYYASREPTLTALQLTGPLRKNMNSKRLIVIANTSKLASVLENCIARTRLSCVSNCSIQHVNEFEALTSELKTVYGDISLEHINDAVVFVDLLLEQTDGMSCIEQLRSCYHQLPIVAYLSESASLAPLEALEIQQQASDAGANATLVAPFNLREIVSTVSRLLDVDAKPSATISAPVSSTIAAPVAAI